MTTINHHDARGPEETRHDLQAVVPAGCSSRSPATSLYQAGVSDRPPIVLPWSNGQWKAKSSTETGEAANVRPG
jgi:hypothetical protein